MSCNKAPSSEKHIRYSVTSPSKLAFACALLLLLAPLPVWAVVNGTITTTTPNEAGGTLKIQIVQDNSGTTVTTAPISIAANQTAAQKAATINTAINSAITAAGQGDLFSSTVSGNVITVLQEGGGGMSIHNLAGDTTGEQDTLQIKLGGGNGSNCFWRFLRWLQSSNTTVPPSGTVMTMTVTEPNGTVLSASQTADGVMTVAQIQNAVTSQFEAQGVTFTTVTNSQAGQSGLSSQYFSGTVPEAGQVQWNAAWATYLGGAGTDMGPTSIGTGDVPTLPQWAAIIMGLALISLSIPRVRRAPCQVTN